MSSVPVPVAVTATVRTVPVPPGTGVPEMPPALRAVQSAAAGATL
ncbi:hypothetical protein [Candidatus Poriferisodalis sp.]